MNITKEGEDQYWLEELRKCEKSPAYFYNNYFTINGQLPKRKITDKEINESKKASSSN